MRGAPHLPLGDLQRFLEEVMCVEGLVRPEGFCPASNKYSRCSALCPAPLALFCTDQGARTSVLRGDRHQLVKVTAEFHVGNCSEGRSSGVRG